MTIAELICWSDAMDAAGKTDPMGYAFSTHRVAIEQPDGSLLRGKDHQVVYITQSEWKRRHGSAVPAMPTALPQKPQLELFA